MAIRKLARSTTSGSRAAFSRTVSPSASVGGHHEVLGAGDGHRLQHQPRALQAPGARLDVAVLDVDVGAHGLQARHMDVDRARADGAAAGQRHIGRAEARHQRPEHQDRGAHGLDQLVGRESIP